MDPDTLRTLIVLTIIFCGVPATIFVLGPIGRAIGQRIVGRHLPPGPGIEETAEDVRDRVEGAERQVADVIRQLDETQQRLMDVEERLDFAERLLAQQAARERLGPGA